MTRGQKTVRMVSFDTQTGVSKVLFEESSATYLELGLDYEASLHAGAPCQKRMSSFGLQSAAGGGICIAMISTPVS